MRKVYQLAAVALASTLVFTACKKEPIINNPSPVEQELITTVRLKVTNNAGFNKTFNYKVDNGFGSATKGTVTIDDLVLSPDMEYNVAVEVWNEAETPAENITEEVIAESHHHLFVLESNPNTGAGSVTISNGSKDNEGQPLNQTAVLKTGAIGTGTFTVTLKHEPTNKSANTADAAGGETDAQAIFPVKIQ